jgi:hypothetical protein
VPQVSQKARCGSVHILVEEKLHPGTAVR